MGQMAYLRLSHNEAKGLTMILHFVFCKQDLPKHLRIALLWNVIWPCLTASDKLFSLCFLLLLQLLHASHT